ncbi:hypothetical protein K438DRAFT_1583395, partial [Mycena galopus ATCC 62051]
MSEALGAGRRAPSLHTNNFTRLDKVSNKGGRYNWKCKHCPNDSAAIEGRDNALAQHLADSRKCPHAPAGVRNEALRFMADKKKTDSTGHPAASSSNGAGSDIVIVDVDAEPEPEPSRKKRRAIHGPLASFLDQAMTTAQQNSADRKLLRFIIHSNSAFRSVENPFLHDFLHDLRPTYDAPGRYAL